VGRSATFVDSTTPVVHIEEGYSDRLLHGAQLEIFRVARNFWSVISQCRSEHRRWRNLFIDDNTCVPLGHGAVV
jgi:hypothetical protein